jgi:radical SAM superfamily enzyme YgiQ (UPF0313 family)
MGPTALLINTNRIAPAVAPLGLDYAADALRAEGMSVELLDLCFASDWRQGIADSLRRCAPVLVGLTLRNTDDCYLASGEDFLPRFAEMVDTVRQNTEAPVAIGGSGYSVFPKAILLATKADYGIAGDGEVPLARLAAALAGDGEIGRVPGLVWRTDGGLAANAPWLGPVQDLPRRDRALADNVRYFAEGGQAGIETKRGCDRHCIYCADPVGKGRLVRMRTPGQVADEFEALLGRGIDHFHLCDSEFNVPVEHATAVCAELERRALGERSRWYTYATPAGFTEELAARMRRAGCVGVNFGADSGDEGMLSSLGRDFQPEDLERTADACRAAGLVFMYDLLLGGPGETRGSIERTIDLVKRISPDRVGVSLGVRVYAGTRLGELVRKAGPLGENASLRGAVEDNPHLLRPVFYLSSALGDDAPSYVADLVGGDQRFFFPTAEAGTEAYNYSDNQRLVDAIASGCRGAYWDILRRLSEDSG